MIVLQFNLPLIQPRTTREIGGRIDGQQIIMLIRIHTYSDQNVLICAKRMRIDYLKV